jgi:hypothetical protein
MQIKNAELCNLHNNMSNIQIEESWKLVLKEALERPSFRQLIAFLKTLTDYKLLSDQRFY